MKALLLIGLQVDLLPGGPAEVLESQSLIGLVNSIVPNYELLVLANFSLPADHAMFAANHLWRRPGQTIPIDGHPTLLQHMFCVSGSFGAEILPGLKIDKIGFAALMGTDKHTPPYSAFFDLGKKRDTGLSTFLSQRKVSELYIAGMPLEDEVVNSAIDSISIGFNTSILLSLSKGRSEIAVNTSLKKAEEAGVAIIKA